MAPDTFERHAIIATLADSPDSILDVGGNRGELAMFLPDAAVTTVNMASEDADYTFDGKTLPFEDKSFDLAVSVDVLEHIPRELRQRHFDELLRVARRGVIVSCPYGSPEHVEAERDLTVWYREVTGKGHRFLEEHIERGLPTGEELETLAATGGHRNRVRYHGDFRQANEAFRASTVLKAKPGPGNAFRYAKLRLDPRRDLELSGDASPHSNRAFVEIFPGSEPERP
ncbi:MAG: class I SAM-dependent methyltransferase [Solirubrobacterales bacterium]|nr:class I SAM-dependent methyltransferase [Solirubrobacterales bacterium]